jgi:hypothetical protein
MQSKFVLILLMNLVGLKGVINLQAEIKIATYFNQNLAVAC